MPPTPRELSLLLHPIVAESLAHNKRVISNIRSLTSFLLGISAAILNLQSVSGFLYYLLGSSVVSLLIHVLLADGRPAKYFAGSGDRGMDGQGKTGDAWRDVWLGGGVLSEGISGFVLGWAGVGGVIR